MTVSPRYNATQQIGYLRKGITFADHNTTVSVGAIPAGSLILKPLSGVSISTAFNGGPQKVDIGPSTDTGTDVWATALNISATTFVPFDESVSFLVAVDTEVQAYVQASAASAGVGQIVIAYIPDNDR